MLNIGFIGCGRISDLHARGYEKEKRARIYAVCDADGELLKRRADEWKAVVRYADYRELMADKRVDAVEILTPQPLHERMVLEALEAGKHVQLQKPMAVNMAEAVKICSAAEAAETVFKVADNYTEYPPFVRAKEIIEGGELGRPTGIRIGFVMGGSGGWEVPSRAWDWRIQEMRQGRGFNTFDHGHHLYATAWYFLGEVEKVSAWIDSRDGVIDCPATVMWKHVGKRVYGSLDFQTAPDMHIPSHYYANDEMVSITCERGLLIVPRCTGEIETGPSLKIFDGRRMRTEEVPSDWALGFEGHTRNFISSILGEEKPSLTAGQARGILKFALAVRKSSDLRRQVYLEEFETSLPQLLSFLRRRREVRAKRVERKTAPDKSPKGLEKFADQAAPLTEDILSRYDREAAKKWTSSVGLILRYKNGEVAHYGLIVKNGEPELLKGRVPETRKATITLNAGLWAAILLGKRKIAVAALQGRVKIEGRTEEALKIKAVFSL